MLNDKQIKLLKLKMQLENTVDILIEEIEASLACSTPKESYKMKEQASSTLEVIKNLDSLINQLDHHEYNPSSNLIN